MTIREFFLENLAGDLEYHPRRAAIYLGLGVAALCFWVFTRPDAKITAVPLVFGPGSLTLLVKGIFLLRRSSEGLGLSQHQRSSVPASANHKDLPSLAAQAAQMFQDFGTGPFLLWPLL